MAPFYFLSRMKTILWKMRWRLLNDHKLRRIRRNPLYQACLVNNALSVEAFLQRGFDPNMKLRYDVPLIYLACIRATVEVVGLLLQYGARPDERDPQTKATGLIVAAAMGRADVVRLLIAQGANVRAKAGTGHDALTKAAQAGHRDVIDVLLLHGVNARSIQGSVALELAQSHGHLDIVELLKQHGATAEIKLLRPGEPPDLLRPLQPPASGD